MQIAAAYGLSFSFATQELFSEISFSVQHHHRIGLVGRNGCGKTTLFKLISGMLQPDSGSITIGKETRIAYMEQFLLFDEAMTLIDAVSLVFAELISLEQRLRQLNRQLEQSPSAALIDEQSRLQEQYAVLGGYTYQGRLRSTLLGLGFSEQDFLLPVSALSGGQRSKAALAKLLLSEANLLLLDEPTNHLDLPSLEWLENFLLNYRGAFIVISHDRYFLDKVTNQTWAMEQGKMRCFSGNYSEHLPQKQSQDENLCRQYQNQLQEIRRIEGIIRQQKRFNRARNYITIASRQKQIERIKSQLTVPDKTERSLSFAFAPPPAGGKDVLQLTELAKSFGENKLFSGVNLQIYQGERVFLLGKNGCGKTTLMKMIMSEQKSDSGTIRLGVNIIPAYYEQIPSCLAGSESILDHLTDSFPQLTQTKIRTMLGSFLFSGDSVEKSLDSLSGGEKARLELLKLMLKPANLLLLDEPTNHIDIDSREAVENALLAYPGTLLVISHDRYLINRLADRVYYLHQAGLTESVGNYDDYLAALDQSAQPPRDDESDSSDAAEQYRLFKEEQSKLRQQEKRRAALAEEMVHLERQIDSVDSDMRDCAPADYLLLGDLAKTKEELEEQLLAVMEEQESLGEMSGA